MPSPTLEIKKRVLKNIGLDILSQESRSLYTLEGNKKILFRYSKAHTAGNQRNKYWFGFPEQYLEKESYENLHFIFLCGESEVIIIPRDRIEKMLINQKPAVDGNYKLNIYDPAILSFGRNERYDLSQYSDNYSSITTITTMHQIITRAHILNADMFIRTCNISKSIKENNLNGSMILKGTPENELYQTHVQMPMKNIESEYGNSSTVLMRKFLDEYLEHHKDYFGNN